MSRRTLRAQVVATVTGLATTGANVFASRVYDIPAGSLPALNVTLGPESLDDDFSANQGNDCYRVEIQIDVHARANSAVDDAVDAVLDEVRAVLDADSTLGGEVLNSWYSGLRDIEILGDGDQPIAVQSIIYSAIY